MGQAWSSATGGVEGGGACETAGGQAAPGPDLAGVTLGHYAIQGRLGAGGFGSVWWATDLRLQRDVAIKLLAQGTGQGSAARALLEAEARAVAALSHPGVVILYALEEADGQLFLVMERVKGRMLGELIPTQGLPYAQVLNLAQQIAEPLAAAHALGIIHRDLNPRNLMVTDEGRVKILDFGLALRQAARVGWVAADAAPGGSNGFTGTVPYMSPEQLEGGQLDGRSDLFSLGVVIYEMAVGQRPFRGESLAHLAAAIQNDEPAWPEVIPTALASVLRKCLAKAPEHRFQSCQELVKALEDQRNLGGGGPGAGLAVAVLPFHDLSPLQDETPFCEGMAEEILAALARIPGVRVASRTSSFPYQHSALAPAELGRRLQVSHLAAGSVKKEGDRLRISVELLEAASGLQLWTERFDRQRQDVFRIQEEIAASLARTMQLNLVPPARPRSAVDLDAYEDYLRGRHYYFRYNRHGMRFAQQMFQQTLDRDPGYAAAWAGLANCAAFLYIYADRSETNRALAESASCRALALDPALAEAHASRGVALSAIGCMAEAEAAFEGALLLQPNLYEAAYFYARHCFANGRQERAIELFEQAARIHPDDCQARLLVAQVYAELGRTDQAEAARRQGLALAEERLRQAPDDIRTRYLGANALVALGERDKGLAWARMVRSLDPEDPMLLYNLGCIHALAHSPEEALDCLEQAVRAGLSQRGWFLNDGDLASIREQPRFQAILVGLVPG